MNILVVVSVVFHIIYNSFQGATPHPPPIIIRLLPFNVRIGYPFPYGPLISTLSFFLNFDNALVTFPTSLILSLIKSLESEHIEIGASRSRALRPGQTGRAHDCFHCDRKRKNIGSFPVKISDFVQRRHIRVLLFFCAALFFSFHLVYYINKIYPCQGSLQCTCRIPHKD